MSYSSEVLADSPLAYWRLGEASGTTLIDSSGNSKDGSYNGTVTHVTGLVSGSADTCVDFNGTNTCADTPAFTGGADAARISVDCFITLDANNKLQIILTRANESFTNRKSFRLAVSSTNHAVFEVWIGGTLYTATSATTLSVGTTYHLAGTFDESTVKVYVNGSPDGSTPAVGSLTLYGIGLGGLLGAGYNGSLYGYFDGKIDEVAYYGTALSDARIAAHYAAGTAIPPSGTGSLSLSASGTTSAPTSGSGSLALSATGAVKAPVAGSGSLALSGAGAIDFQPAAGTASLVLSAAGAAGVGVAGTAALTISGTGTAAGATAASGTAALALSAAGSATLAASGTASLTFGAIGTAFALFVTDLTNAMNGRRRRGRATAWVDRPAAALPPGRTFGPRYDKAIAYPTPDMVDGRPT